MTTLDSALDAAESLQHQKLQQTSTRTPAGDGPDRPMPYIAALPAGELFVDHSYQRPLEQTRVRRMVQAWDPTMLGVLDVADRGSQHDPRYAVIAGQHRHAAALAADPRGADTPLVCNVHRGLGVDGEAQLMHDLDRTHKKLTGHDRWKARRAAGEDVVLAIEAVASAHGLRIEPNRGEYVLTSYGAAEHLHAVGGRELLDNTLGVLVAAYDGSPAAWQAPLLTGVGRFIHDEENLDVDRLTRALAAERPERIRAQAAALREIEAGQLSQLVTRVVAGLYRRAKSGGRS